MVVVTTQMSLKCDLNHGHIDAHRETIETDSLLLWSASGYISIKTII